MAYDDKGNYRNVDVLLRMREHNRSVQRQWLQRAERIEEARQTNAAVQIVPPEPTEARLPAILHSVFDKMRKTRGDFRLLHFSFQLGRLRIELSQAKGTAETTRTGGRYP